MKQKVTCPKCHDEFEIDKEEKKPRLVIKYNIDNFNFEKGD